MNNDELISALAKAKVEIQLGHSTQVGSTRVTCLTPYPAIAFGYNSQGVATHASAKMCFLLITEEKTVRRNLWGTFAPELVSSMLQYVNDQKIPYTEADFCFYGSFALTLSESKETRHHLIFDATGIADPGIEECMRITQQKLTLSSAGKFNAKGRFEASVEEQEYLQVDVCGYILPSLTRGGEKIVRIKNGSPAVEKVKDANQYEKVLYPNSLANGANESTYPNRVKQYYTELLDYIPTIAQEADTREFYTAMAAHMPPSTRPSNPVTESMKEQFKKKEIVGKPTIPTAPTVKAPAMQAPTMTPPTIKR